jgi:ankyrin repeat protein
MKVRHAVAVMALSLLALAPAAAGAAAIPGAPALLDAVERGDADNVRLLLEQGANVNGSAPDGTTALHVAVQREDRTLVDLLLRAGADTKAVNRYGVAPLFVAVTAGNAPIVERLLTAGADPKAALPEGETALMTASRTGNADVIRVLLARGADPNATESLRGQTALMWAAAENHGTAIKALATAGAKIDARSSGGFTPLLFAVRAGRIDSVRALLESGADVNDTVQPPNARPAAPAAPRPPAPSPNPTSSETRTDPQLAALLRVFDTGIRAARGNGAGMSALVLAVLNAHFELAAFLVEQGADANAAVHGWTALHQIAWTRRPPIQHGLPPAVPTGQMDSLALARLLLTKGANPNLRQTREPGDGARSILNRLGSTPYLQAAKLADVPYMRVLLEHGADPSIATEEGATPLMAAAGVGIWHVGESAGTNEEAFEAVKLAYEQGNDVNAVDANGDTALHGAAHRGADAMVRFLVEKGAKLNVPNRLGWTPWIIADGVFYPNTYNRHIETAELLLKLGADPTAGRRRPEDLPPSEAQAVASARPPR